MIRTMLNAIYIGILIMMGGYYFHVPNLYRIATPQYFGVVEVNPLLFTDAPERSAEFERMIDIAERRSQKFFKRPSAKPIYIVCTTQQCRNEFALFPAGLAAIYHRIIIAPEGILQTVFNHEQVHVDMHQTYAAHQFVLRKFPVWYSEGLAEYLSGSGRAQRKYPRESKQRVMAIKSQFGWNELLKARGADYAYGASAAIVADIARAVGRNKLLEITVESTSLQDFYSRIPRFVLPSKG